MTTPEPIVPSPIDPIEGIDDPTVTLGHPMSPAPDTFAIEIAVSRGRASGLAKGIVTLCDVLEIPLDEERLAVMERLDATHLETLLDSIRDDRRWP